MKYLAATLLGLIATSAQAQNAGDYYQPQLITATAQRCGEVRVRWAPSPYPTAPYPSMNILRAGLENTTGKLIVVNIEMETASFS